MGKNSIAPMAGHWASLRPIEYAALARAGQVLQCLWGWDHL